VWEFLTEILKIHGVLAVVAVLQGFVIIYLFRLLKQRNDEKAAGQEKILNVSEKRLADLIEEREEYRKLAIKLDQSLNLLIQIFRKRNGNGHGE
jgi:hypothetical protein